MNFKELKSSPYVKKQIEKDERQKDSLMNDLDSKMIELLKYKEYFLALKEEMEQQQSSFEDEKEELQGQINRFKKIAIQLRKDKENAEDLVNQTNEQLDKVKSRISRYTTTIQKAKSDLSDARKEAQECRNLSDNKDKELEKANQEKNELNEEIENLNLEYQQKDQQNKKLRNRVNQLSSDKLETEQDLQEMIELLDQANSGRPINITKYRTSSNLPLDTDSPSARLKTHVIGLVKNLDQFQRKNKNLTRQLDDRQSELQILQEQKNNLEKQLPLKIEEVKNTKNITHLLARGIVPLQQENERLALQNEFLKKRSKEYDNLKKQVDQLQQQLTGSRPKRQKSEKFQEIVKTIIENQKIKPLKKILMPSNYKSYIIENTTNFVSLIPKEEITSTIPRNVLYRARSYSTNPNPLKNQFDDEGEEEEYKDVELFTEMITHFYPEYFTESKKPELSNEFLEKEEQIFGEFSSREETTNQKDPQIDLMKRVGQTMKNKINNLENENDDLNNNLQLLGRSKTKLQKEFNLAKSKNQELEQDNLEKDINLNKANSIVKQLRIKIRKLEEEKSFLVPAEQLEELERQLQNAKRNLSNYARNLKQTQTRLSDSELENSGLKDDITQIEKEKQLTQRKLDHQTNKSNDLLLEIQRLTEELEALRNNLEQTQSNSDKFKNMVNRLKNKDNAMKKRVGILDRQINAYKKHMDILKEEISTTLDKEVDEDENEDLDNLDF
ncbi:structural maintenance of chromosomes protein [Anaeramoeba flamelloides]|uniref:Structural maintenance of chromosomes protein n=1 Tax=Anaeramoeba flamelloides TaxID=1746091 RepID=A0AAV7Y5V1_9EUKA|nr:structural maintenance of chromosomes protein [Anaeramoeba flamelloides]